VEIRAIRGQILVLKRKKGNAVGLPWMKVEISTPEKPEVLLLSINLGVHPLHAFGLCFKFWRWCDGQLVESNARRVTEKLVDMIVGHEGFAVALIEVGWLQVRQGSLVIPNFDRHLSEGAKSRALSGRRQAEFKAKQSGKSNAQGNEDADAQVTQPPLPDKIRKDQKRIQNKESPPTHPESTPPVASNPPAGATNSNDAVSLTWGVVAERLRKMKLGRVNATIESAKEGGYSPVQLTEWMDYLDRNPSVGVGAIVERLKHQDSLHWASDWGWPPSDLVAYPDAKPSTPVYPIGRGMSDSEKAELERLEELCGAVLDRMSDLEVITLAPKTRSPINVEFWRTDPSKRLQLLGLVRKRETSE
jgi:hypothetical protein